MSVRAIVQVGVLSLLYVGSDALARVLHSPIPGNVLGAVMLSIALLAGWVPLRWFEHGADLLLRHLALLFVPAAVLVVRILPTVRRDLPAIAIVMIATTFLGMTVAGLAARRGR